MNTIKRIRQSALGRWEVIHQRLGIFYDQNGKHGPCPVCGGTDRFRFDNLEGRGTWFCNQCEHQAGDGIQLVKNFLGCSLLKAAQVVEKELKTLAKEVQRT